jgi:hypothetical protein
MELSREKEHRVDNEAQQVYDFIRISLLHPDLQII